MFCDDLEHWLNLIYEDSELKDEIVGWHSQYIYELLLIRDMDYDTVVRDLLKASIELMHVSSGGSGLLCYANELRNTAAALEVRVRRGTFRNVNGVGMPTNQNQPTIPSD